LLYFALQDLEQKMPGESDLFWNVVTHCKQVFNIKIFMPERLFRYSVSQPIMIWDGTWQR
jgi:hypothetical protein